MRLDEHGAVAGRIAIDDNIAAVAGDGHATYVVSMSQPVARAFTVDGSPLAAFGSEGAVTIPPVRSGVRMLVQNMTMGAAGSIDVPVNYAAFDLPEVLRLTSRGAFDPA